MLKKVVLVTGAVLLAGTSLASAQVRDDPPGWAFQRRGIIESQGYPATGRYDHYGYGGYYYAPRRYYDYGPPGARYQDRRIREENGWPW